VTSNSSADLHERGSFYVGDDWKFAKNFQSALAFVGIISSRTATTTALPEVQQLRRQPAPRFGFIWDFTGKGKGKIFANYAQFIEAPIP
jgi:hypothetical protein